MQKKQTKIKDFCVSLVYGTLDTKVSGVLAVTEPSGGSFQSLMVAGKRNTCARGATSDLCELSGMPSSLSGRGWHQFGAVDHDCR